jgi:trk system potassium uptake protein TrkA
LIAERIFKVPKIVARVNDPGKKAIYFQLGIDTINPVQYEIEIIKSQLFLKSDSNVNLAHYFVDKGESL